MEPTRPLGQLPYALSGARTLLGGASHPQQFIEFIEFILEFQFFKESSVINRLLTLTFCAKYAAEA
jgi:hypothetical protein